MRGQMTHLDADVLADFRAGLITGRRGAQIGAHLAVCDQCAMLGGQLAGVSALLAAVPATAMPDLVALRLDAALAGEVARRDQASPAGSRLSQAGSQLSLAEVQTDPAAARPGGDAAGPGGDAAGPGGDGPRPGGDAAGPGGDAAGPGGDGPRDHRRRPARNWNLRLVALRVLAPAAAVALFVAGGYALSLGSSTSSQASSSSAGRAAAPAGGIAGASSGAGTRVAAPLESGQPAASAAPTPRSHRMSPAAFPVVAGTVNFLPATFKQQVEAALRVPEKARQTQTSPAALRACVQALAGSVSPLLVESARYQGQPATLIVVAAGSRDTVWMTGSRCSAADHDVLDRTTVPPGISGP